MGDIPYVQLITSGQTILNCGNPAYLLEFTETYGKGQNQYKTMEVQTIKGDKLYRIEYIAETIKYFSYLPRVQKMIDSFQLIKIAANNKESINNNLAFQDLKISNQTILFCFILITYISNLTTYSVDISSPSFAIKLSTILWTSLYLYNLH